MKLVTFETKGARHIGAVLGDGKTIADFTAASRRAAFPRHAGADRRRRRRAR